MNPRTPILLPFRSPAFPVAPSAPLQLARETTISPRHRPAFHPDTFVDFYARLLPIVTR